MKTLIVYETYTGLTEQAAKKAAEALGCEIVRVTDRKGMEGKFSKILAALFTGRKPRREFDLEQTALPLADYDLVLLACPIWAGLASPAMRSFALAKKKELGKIAILLTQGRGDGYPSAFADLERLSGEFSGFSRSICTKPEPIQQQTAEFVDSFVAYVAQLTEEKRD